MNHGKIDGFRLRFSLFCQPICSAWDTQVLRQCEENRGGQCGEEPDCGTSPQVLGPHWEKMGGLSTLLAGKALLVGGLEHFFYFSIYWE